MLVYLSMSMTLGWWAAISPGPFQAFLLSQTLKNGWRRTLPASLAPLLSDGPIIALVLLILTQVPAWFLLLLQIFGGFFILYLAKGAYLVARKPILELMAPPESVQQGFWKAVLMNGLNPNPFIFWSLIAGPTFLTAWREAPILGLSFLAGFYVMLISGSAGFIMVFGLARRFGAKASRLLNGISALILFLFGVYQIWTGLITLWA